MNLLHKILHLLNLDSETDDFDRINQTISKDSEFKGTNLWILMIAIVIASVGLNMNSTAVIIGAMLISPLMGPINGMGFSIATYNFDLLRRAVKNFTFAVIGSLFASTLYFTLSPISTAYSELLARTTPSIYDVIIALFGGMAGILAISTNQRGNVVPGVAIATALMPPLCTAGYGLATAQFSFFFGAMYLFTINTVFIALSSVIVSQILKFPITAEVSQIKKKKINNWITITIVVILVPSIYFGYNLVQQEKFNDHASKFIKSVSMIDGNYLLDSEIIPNKQNIKLIYAGTKLSDELKRNVLLRAADFSLENANIEFVEGLNLERDLTKNTEIDNLKTEINRLNITINNKNKYIDSLQIDDKLSNELLPEVKELYPEINNLYYSQRGLFKGDTIERSPFIFFLVNENGLKKIDREKITNWAKIRLRKDSIETFFIE